MENDDKLFEFMTKLYSEMQRGFKEVNNRLDNVENRLDNVENRLDNVEKSVVFIENDHGRKLDALFDGYKQNYEKLTTIEEEVTKHDEIILRRVSEK